MTPDSTTNEARKWRDRPFPWPCVNCLKEEVYPEKMPYTVKIKHDGRLHHIHNRGENFRRDHEHQSVGHGDESSPRENVRLTAELSFDPMS